MPPPRSCAPGALALALTMIAACGSSGAPPAAPDAGDAAPGLADATSDSASPDVSSDGSADTSPDALDIADGNERIDTAPAAGWQSLPALPVPRMEVGVAALRDQIYVVGGTVGPAVTATTTSVHAFDPATGAWRERRAVPLPGLSHANVAVVGERLYLLGPSTNGQVLAYDPDADVWTAGKPAPLPFTDRGAAAIGVIGGKIYVAGGGFGSRVFGAYDPQADSWQALPTLDVGRDHVAGAAVGGTLYVIGGADRFRDVATDRVDAYDVTAGTWTQRTPMPTPRSGAAAVVVAGEIIVVGGEGSPGSGLVSAAVEAYDPARDSWRTLAPMKTPRHGIGAAVAGGKIYVPGGSTVMNFGPGGETFEVLTP